jgi:hypothetical protein
MVFNTIEALRTWLIGSQSKGLSAEPLSPVDAKRYAPDYPSEARSGTWVIGNSKFRARNNPGQGVDLWT